MVRGISTDGDRYKHKKHDTKWLSKDLQDIKRTTEKYIESIRPEDEKETPQLQVKKKKFTVVNILAILMLGILGIFAFFTGIYLIFLNNYVIGIPLTIIGAVFVITFILFEKFR